MADRELILAAFPPDTGGERPGSAVATKTAPKEELWSVFVRMLMFHRGEVSDLASLKEFKSRSVYDDDLPYEAKAFFREPVSDVWSADAGVTLVDAAVAETGSLLLSTSPERRRLNSLVPPVHVALVDRAQVVASLDEGLSRLSPRSSVMVTGPSRTADVEGVIVMGVHGPKRLIVVPWPEETPA
jgi:L-lactate utilization protein LutC